MGDPPRKMIVSPPARDHHSGPDVGFAVSSAFLRTLDRLVKRIALERLRARAACPF
jgi:hypothetical protein